MWRIENDIDLKLYRLERWEYVVYLYTGLRFGGDFITPRLIRVQQVCSMAVGRPLHFHWFVLRQPERDTHDKKVLIHHSSTYSENSAM